MNDDMRTGVKLGLQIAWELANQTSPEILRPAIELALNNLEDVAGAVDPETFARTCVKRNYLTPGVELPELNLEAIAVRLSLLISELEDFEQKVIAVFGTGETIISQHSSELETIIFDLAGIPYVIHQCDQDDVFVDGVCEVCRQNNGAPRHRDWTYDYVDELKSDDPETIKAGFRKARTWRPPNDDDRD